MQNALTIDVEDWYQTMDFNFPLEKWGSYEDRIEYSLKKLIDLLGENNIKATFFVLGYIAKKHPKLIRKLAEEGHEVASHGSFHKLVYKETEEEFREDIKYARNTIEEIIGKEVVIFRASTWSISKNTLWALEILEDEGFICDSSIQPFQTQISGIKGAPINPYHPIIDGKKLKILEFPPTVLSFYKVKVPFCGGLYLRILPSRIVKYFLNQVNKERNGLIYIHPWEVDTNQPKLKVAPHIKLSHYYNLHSTMDKFSFLIKNFDFVPLGEIIRNNSFVSIKL